MDDMILDMENFDFNMLDSEEFVEEVVEDVEDLVEVDEESEEVEESEVEEAEETADDEEEVTEVEEPDEEEVEFDSYELTLPTGETVVLSDLVNGYKGAAEVEAMRKEVEEVKADFEAKSGNIAAMLQLAKLEADRVIEDYEDFDWATLSKEDPASYVENREFLDKYKARAKEIRKTVELVKEKEEAETKRVTQEKARQTNAALAKDIPGWGPDMYKKLIGYAVENGASEEDMLNVTDAYAFKLLHKAMEFEKGKQVVKAKVKRVGSPKKVVKATAKVAPVSKNVNRDALIKKAEKEGDMSALFNLLED